MFANLIQVLCARLPHASVHPHMHISYAQPLWWNGLPRPAPAWSGAAQTLVRRACLHRPPQLTTFTSLPISYTLESVVVRAGM